jgi:hypothetical protein
LSLNFVQISNEPISYHYSIFLGGFLNCAASIGMMFLLSSFLKNKQIAAELGAIITFLMITIYFVILGFSSSIDKYLSLLPPCAYRSG